MIKVYIAGHTGMVGSSITRKLSSIKKFRIIKATRVQLDLLNYKKTFNFIKKKKPDLIIICAAKVGGILKKYEISCRFLFR